MPGRPLGISKEVAGCRLGDCPARLLLVGRGTGLPPRRAVPTTVRRGLTAGKGTRNERNRRPLPVAVQPVRAHSRPAEENGEGHLGPGGDGLVRASRALFHARMSASDDIALDVHRDAQTASWRRQRAGDFHALDLLEQAIADAHSVGFVVVLRKGDETAAFETSDNVLVFVEDPADVTGQELEHGGALAIAA